jgi:hypothetical protein
MTRWLLTVENSIFLPTSHPQPTQKQWVSSTSGENMQQKFSQK